MATLLSLLLLFARSTMAWQLREAKFVVWRDLKINYGQVSKLSRALIGKADTIIGINGSHWPYFNCIMHF